MAEHVIPAVLAAGLSIIESYLRTKYEELSGVSGKMQRLEWLFLKIRCAIEESRKYDIRKNGLREMQQRFVDAAAETEELLDALRCSEKLSTALDPTVKFSPFNIFAQRCFSLEAIRRIDKLNHLLDKLEQMCDDVGIFLEMVRRQKRKRERRKNSKFRPCKHFFELVYLSLVQDAVDYCRAQMLWMQLLLPGIANLVNNNRESRSNSTSTAGISAVPKVWLDVLNFLRKSLQLV